CGILVCGTGIGMSIAANRHKEIRAALCHEAFTARMSREHKNADGSIPFSIKTKKQLYSDGMLFRQITLLWVCFCVHE
ncbi:MAG: RpiB/LacA/LacB family sugar-phosphate isomerase, partial [Candidatus Electrothrix sp. AR5]|nr:RpiB/LacA/LacB family sugar-phosphate isomerase [Candidatus Electrothrix sp. AR5]